MNVGDKIQRTTIPLDKTCPLEPGDVRTLLAILKCQCGFEFVDVGLKIAGSYCQTCGMVLSQTNWLSPIQYWQPYTGAKIVSIRKNILGQSKN